MGRPIPFSIDKHGEAAAPVRRGSRALWLAAAAFAFAAALMLWVRFGPTAFVNALTAAWTCL